MARNKGLSYWQKILLGILIVYIFILFVGGFIANCIIGREEPTMGQCTNNQFNMAITLGFNEMVEYFQRKAERKGERITNMLENLGTGSGIIKIETFSGGLDIIKQ